MSRSSLSNDRSRTRKLGAKPRHIWQDAVIRWAKEQSHKNSIKTDVEPLRWLDDHLHDKYLDEIDVNIVQRVQDATRVTGVKNGTVNRVMALLREWQWLDKSPYVRMLPTAEKRICWLTQGEAEKLLKELPSHLETMARFSLATGLREANVVGLEWSQIDMQRRCAWIHPEQAKAKKAIAVPLNDNTLAVIHGQIGKHITHVFTYTRVNNHAWRKALKRAGITDFRWHDLRHTWASWHIQNGTPLHVLQELGGWADSSMVLRYAHLSSEHLQSYAGNAGVVTNLLHSQ
ncbi:MAG: site-specific integrase [Methylobacter sp.]|nr:MAG: site-specific integrase [Methylobacter sp.]